MTAQNTRDLYVGIGLVLVGILTWFVAIPYGIDMPSKIQQRALAPDFWPRIISVGVALCGAIMVVSGVLERRAAEGEIEGVSMPSAKATVRVLATIAGLLAFYFSIEFLGIVLSSIIVILAFTIFLYERRWKYTLPLAFLLPTMLYYFFFYIAGIPLPTGILEGIL